MKEKRGLTPAVATILLVLLMIILGSIVFLWARGFIKEQIQKFDAPIESQCQKVLWDVNYIPGDYPQLEIHNQGNIGFYSVAVKLTKGGTQEINQYEINLHVGSSTNVEIETEMKGGIPASKMEVYPVLLGDIVKKEKKKPFICQDNGHRINL